MQSAHRLEINSKVAFDAIKTVEFCKIFGFSVTSGNF